MKILNKIWGISLLAFLLIIVAPHKSKAQDENITEQDFYDNLEPYGTWINDAQYGDVWVPDAEDDFRPYATQGHWVLTEYGNTWVSDYPWGWATFHYGRWHYDDYYGWEWIPGYEWAPAWVSWRQGGGYYGWAPLTPGISVSLSFGSDYNIPDYYWVCAPQAYINRPNIYNYYVPHTRVVNIIHRTTIINNTYSRNNRRYIAGPRAQDIQRFTHQRPQVYKINNANRPGAINVHNNAVNMYRPMVKKTPGARPSRVVDANAYKKQNPNQGIGHRGSGGAAAYNHANASKLAAIARNPIANNKVVRVNRPGGRPGNAPVQPNHAKPGNTPGHQGNRPAGKPGGRPVQQNPAQPGNAPGQPANKPNSVQHGNHPARTQARPNLVNPNRPAQQPGNTQHLQQQRAQREQQRAQKQQVQPQQQAQQVQREQQQAQQQQRQQQQQAQRQQQVQQQQRQQQQQQAQHQQRQQQQQAQRQQQQQAQQQQRQQQQAQRQQQQQAQQQQRQQQQQAQRQQQQQAQQQQRQQMQQQQHRQPPPQQSRPEEHRP